MSKEFRENEQNETSKTGTGMEDRGKRIAVIG